MGTFTDGLINLVSRLGASADKSAHNTYVSGLHSPAEIQAAYQTSWYGHIVDIIAEDCFREWRAVQGENEEIEAIEKEEARLKSRLHIHDAYKIALTEGGSAVFMGGLPGDPAMPVNVNQIGVGALKYLAVMRKDEIRAHDRIRDPLDPNFGQPSWYEVNQKRIHPSRVIRFIGMPRQNQQNAWDGWGDPLWARLQAAVSNLDAASAGMAAMVQEAKLDIIKIPGFTEMVSTQAGENMIMRRLMVGNQMKSILNALVMDAGDPDGRGGEDYETKQLSFGGLDKVWDRHALALSGMSGIPQTRLYGRSPEGMNSTGEADEANHAKAIKARQELHIEPALAGYNEIIIRSALGRRPEKVYFEWRSLYSISEYQASEIEKRYAEAMATRINTGAISDEVLAKSELNRMIESGRYPGVEAAIKEAGDDGMPSEEEAREIEAMSAQAENPIIAANDVAPRSLYVRRDVINKAEIIRWAKSQGFATVMDDLHVTVTYSRAEVDWMKMGRSWMDKIDIPAGGPRVMDRFGDAVVLLITENELTWRNQEMREKGASFDHAEYQPHVTISYEFDGSIASIEPYQGKIVLGPEIFEEIDDDYRSGIVEK